MALPKVKHHHEKANPLPSKDLRDLAHDDEFEADIERWNALSDQEQRDRLAPVVASLGVGGP